MQLSLGLDEFVVFDFETTGLSAWGGDEVIEIGAMKIYGDTIDEENIFHSLVNPRRLIPSEASKVNGISNEMVTNAPTIDQVFPKFLDYIGSSWLIAQNAKFDMGFVMKYLVQFKVKREIEVYDTMVFSRRAFPGESKHNLTVISERLGLEIIESERHRSIGDVKLTAKAFVKMRDMLGGKCPGREKYSI